MGLKLTILATAAILLPAAASAQEAPPPQEPPTTTQPDEPAPPQTMAPGQTQTTPGQTQTTPGQATETAPPDTGQAASQPAADQTKAVAKATAADVKAGASVYDPKGDLVGKVVSSSEKGVVIDTGTTKASIPLASLGKSDKGLVLGMTKAELEAAAKKSAPKPK